MRPAMILLLTGAGAAVLCASGCFGPMYNPNGPWGGSGYSNYNYPGYGQPGIGAPGTFQTLTPGPQYTPGVDSGGGSAPTPTYNNGGNNVPVPNPSDPYYPPRSGASADPLGEAPPFSAISTPRDGQLAVQSLPGQAHGPSLRTAGMSHVRPTNDGTNYGHDESGYEWLQGVVSFDPADQTWNIVYNLDPGSQDQYAGHFTLSNTPLVRAFQEGDRVRLEGRVDPVERDRFGKPTYLPERIIRSAA